MYALVLNGVRVPSQDIAAMVARYDELPESFAHLSAIEHLEARGMEYANQDFDVLSAAHGFARRQELAWIARQQSRFVEDRYCDSTGCCYSDADSGL